MGQTRESGQRGKCVHAFVLIYEREQKFKLAENGQIS